MAADLYRSALVQQTRAALHALEQALLSEQELTSQAVAVLLERWGDALRLGESVPPKLRAKADEIELDTLGAALRQRIEELDAWTIPEPDDEASDARLGFALCRRDETESLLQGLTRLMLARRGLPADVAGLETLCEGLAEFDAELGRRVHRRQAEAALGIRVALHDENTWLASLPLPEPTGVAESTQGAEFVLSGAQAGERPSDAIVDRYVRRGAVRAYVEGHAVRDQEFAEDLVEVIDELQAIGESISLVAAVWRKQQTGKPMKRSPLHYSFTADRREAAASVTASATELERRELGPLPGVDAEAALERRGNELALIVYPERALERLVVGETECAGPEPNGSWVVRIAISDGMAPLRVLVVDDAGHRFEDIVEIELL